jgi:hypothetical protein
LRYRTSRLESVACSRGWQLHPPASATSGGVMASAALETHGFGRCSGARKLRRIRSRPSIPHRNSTFRDELSMAFCFKALSLEIGDIKGGTPNCGGSDRFLCHLQRQRVNPPVSRPRIHVLLPPLSGSRTGHGSPQITPPLMQLKLPLSSRQVSLSKSRISKFCQRCMWRLHEALLVSLE